MNWQVESLKSFWLFWGDVAIILQRGLGDRFNSDMVIVLEWALTGTKVIVLLVYAEPVFVFNLVVQHWDTPLRDLDCWNALQKTFELDSGRSPITLCNAKGSSLLQDAFFEDWLGANLLELHLRT